jgi:hypothetical protein
MTLIFLGTGCHKLPLPWKVETGDVLHSVSTLPSLPKYRNEVEQLHGLQ